MAGKRDSWLHELLRGARQYESATRVLYSDQPHVALGPRAAPRDSEQGLPSMSLSRPTPPRREGMV